MRVRLLGTAAGGGVPQWNCNCRVCREARAGTGRVQSRTQSSIALTADGRRWFLLNASPDLRFQIEATPELRPPAGVSRGSPIEAVLLTNADLDHTLGLFLMREGQPLAMHATPTVQRSLSKSLSLAPVLGAFCGVESVRPPVKPSPLVCRDGSESGLLYHAVPLTGRPPRYVRQRRTATAGHVIGYCIMDAKTGGRLLFLPDVAELTKGLIGLLGDCDVLLFDGTFWANDELQRAGVGTLTASAMGHLPISGARGSLKALARLQVRQKVFVHINNTNPILLEDSPEHAAVLAAGCTVGQDGMEFEV